MVDNISKTISREPQIRVFRQESFFANQIRLGPNDYRGSVRNSKGSIPLESTTMDWPRFYLSIFLGMAQPPNGKGISKRFAKRVQVGFLAAWLSHSWFGCLLTGIRTNRLNPPGGGGYLFGTRHRPLCQPGLIWLFGPTGRRSAQGMVWLDFSTAL